MVIEMNAAGIYHSVLGTRGCSAESLEWPSRVVEKEERLKR